jgi:hypothetical protein
MDHADKYLHCVKCQKEGKMAGLAVFVSKIGDLGVECIKHEDFKMKVPNKEVSDYLLSIALEPCNANDCDCEGKEVSH